MDLQDFDLKTGEPTGETSKLAATVAEKAELVIRTFLGKRIPDFKVAETTIHFDHQVMVTAIYTTPEGKSRIAQFAFYEFDPVVVEGGLIKHEIAEKGWFFSCSSGFLDKNYDRVLQLLLTAAEREVYLAAQTTNAG